LPGDPAVYFAGPAATPQSIAEIRKSLGLDRPLPDSSPAMSTISPMQFRQFAVYRPSGRDRNLQPPAGFRRITLSAFSSPSSIAVPLGIWPRSSRAR